MPFLLKNRIFWPLRCPEAEKALTETNVGPETLCCDELDLKFAGPQQEPLTVGR
jgi:hypothetical protein